MWCSVSDEFTVIPPTLFDSANDWNDQAARLATARARLVDSSTAGFPDAVRARVGTWTSGWGTEVGALADRSRGVADQLNAAYLAYLGCDLDAQDQFQTWLRDAP